MRPASIAVVTDRATPHRLTDFTIAWSRLCAWDTEMGRLGGETPFEGFTAPVWQQHRSRVRWMAHLAVLRSQPTAPVLVCDDRARFADGFTLEFPDPPQGWQVCWPELIDGLAYLAASPADLAGRLVAGPSADVRACLATAGGQYRQEGQSWTAL